jgi:methyltransferase (TIGR00027 family)
LDFEHDDVLDVLTRNGYRPDDRTFFVWEAVTQYLSADAVHATLDRLRQAAPGSRLVFTYIRRDFIDGINLYGAQALYRRFRQRQQLWQFGLPPDEVATFLAGHGWQLAEQAGPDLIMQRYVEPTGRHLTVSPIEWSAYAEKA